MFSHVVTQLSQRYHVKREPSLLAALRLHDIDHVIVVFDVLGPQVQQFIDADSRAITNALVGSQVHCSCRARYLNEYVPMRHQC